MVHARTVGILVVCLIACPGKAVGQGARRARYAAEWADGVRGQSSELTGWDSVSGTPKLGQKPLTGPNPLRWLRDRELRPGAPPMAFVETTTGDVFPGQVVDFVDYEHEGRDAVAAYFRVIPRFALEASEPPATPYIRILKSYARRIVWQRQGRRRYTPGRAWYRDGREVAFRALRWSTRSVSLLTEAGPLRIPFVQLAELHLPATGFWPAYLRELARLAPHSDGRLLQVETVEGLLATASLSRLMPFSKSPGLDARRWVHVLQPAWSLDALWLPNSTIWMRRSYAPHELDLTRVPPDAVEQNPMVGQTPIPWRRSRNSADAMLRSGGRDFGWGWGTHGETRFRFHVPPLVSGMSATFGLDRSAGGGGCVRGRILADDRRIFESPFMVGTGRTVNTGMLPVRGSRLTIEVDSAHDNRPPGADPFDIRDSADWLHPLLLLDAVKLPRELAKHHTSLIRAWRDWQVGLHADVRFVESWDEVADSPGRFRLSVVSPTKPLSIQRTLKLADTDRWLIVVATHARPTDPSPTIRIRINGQVTHSSVVAPFAPGHQRLRPIILDLQPFRGTKPSEFVIEQSASATPVQWHSIRIVSQLPNRQPLLDDRGALVELDASGQETKPAQLAERYDKDHFVGQDCSKLDGNTSYRLTLPGTFAFREQPAWGEYRYLRFAMRKRKGRFSMWLVKDDPGRPVARYVAGPGVIRDDEKSVWPQALSDAWIVVTLDVFGDGGDRDVRGLVFRSLDDEPVLIDHIYAASSLEALDSIPAVPNAKETNRRALLKLVEPVLTQASPACVKIRFADRRIVGGVIVSPRGEVLTAGHAVGKLGDRVKIISGDKTLSAHVKGFCRSSDLALLQIAGPGPFRFLPVNDSSQLRESDLYLGMTLRPGTKEKSAEVQPHVARLRRATAQELWTDAETEVWLSGGPLVDKGGNVVGVLFRRSRFGGFLYARSTTFRSDLERMRKGEAWGRWHDEAGPTFGAELATEQTSSGPRCVITAVALDSPAAKSGLRKGDSLVRIAATDIKRREDALKILAGFDAGQRVRVAYVRSQQRVDIELQLINRP